jgi:hypothetical protein
LEDYLKAVDALTIDPTKRLQKQLEQQQERHSEEWYLLMNKIQRLEEKYGGGSTPRKKN